MKHIKTLGGCCALTLVLTSARAVVLAHYSFDTGFSDSSGNGFNGTLVEGLGIPTTSSGGAPAGTPGDSYIDAGAGNSVFGGAAMHFSTDRDIVTLPFMAFASSDAWSISFWARVAAPFPGESASSATFDMVMGNTTDNNNFIALGQASTSRFRGLSSAAANQQDFAAAGVGNGWNQFALVADGLGSLKIYENGSLLTSATGKNTTFNYNAIGEAYSVNTTANDFDFHGEIDEVWVFNNAIDATTVNNLYSVNAVPEPASIALVLLGGLGLAGLRRGHVK